MRAAPPVSASSAVVASGRSHLVRRAVWTFLIVFGIAMAFAGFRVHEFVTSSNASIPPVAPTPLRALSDLRHVHVTITTPEWKKLSSVVTVDQLRTDHRLWRQMHFGDWDLIAREFRELALHGMVRSYRPLFAGPAVWRQMPTTRWDSIPQPIRAMAYLRMIWFWARHEALGAEFGLSWSRLAATVGAIVMAESWFEHRAMNENQWGNRDLGLAQCSDHCRETLDAMAREGTIPFTPSEADYFNPWSATRIATIWFERELLRAEGDVDLAIRAYHRGFDNAMDEKGDAYHARVVRLRERYIRSQEASPTWRFLTKRIMPL